MKLYTEEQVRQAIQMADKYHYLNESEDDSIINTLTPIEIPSDEEIESSVNKRLFLSDKHAHFNSGAKAGFKLGATWMKEQILNQNK